ncbi:hypothetical protein CDAR_2541 [Caerostris darwini]|uniref:Uncharacterized protein n=1 Tax=Caerostris darwini TaxID=1538125 RepID=A0AAV4N1C1_9ARAC|nr:hypothetical protein CDAR_2541 [Caerostris darwini]
MSVEERPDKRVPARMNGGKVKVSMSHKYRSFHTEDTSNFHSPRAPLASQSTSSFTVCQVKSGGATTTRSLGSPSFPGPYRNVPCPPPARGVKRLSQPRLPFRTHYKSARRPPPPTIVPDLFAYSCLGHLRRHTRALTK